MTTQRKPITHATRFAVLARAGFRCTYCGQPAPEVVLHVDHAIPLSRGGTDDPENLVAACSACNQGKADRPIGVSRRCAGERHVGAPEGPFPYLSGEVAWTCPACNHILTTAAAA